MLVTMHLELKFGFAEKVIFDNKIGKDEGVVCGFNIKPGGCILYEVVWSDKKQTSHYDFELKAQI